MEAELCGKLIALSAFIKDLESSQTKELKVHLKPLANKEVNTAKTSIQQEITKPGLQSIH